MPVIRFRLRSPFVTRNTAERMAAQAYLQGKFESQQELAREMDRQSKSSSR